MNRWSLSTTFRKVSLQDFQSAANLVRTTMTQAIGGAVDVEIKTYNGIPHACTMMLDPGMERYLADSNEQKVSATFNSIHAIDQTAWKDAVYVEARFTPSNENNAPDYCVAFMEAKGLRPKQISYYAQGGDVGSKVQRATKAQFSSWWPGDGMQSNKSVSLS